MRSFNKNHALITLAVCITIFGCGKPSDNEAVADGASSAAPQEMKGLNGYISSPLHDAARETGARRNTVRSAQVGVTVEDVSKADSTIAEVVRGMRGYVAKEVGNDLASDHPSIYLTLRVPEESFESAMTTIQKLGRVVSKQITAADVTEDILNVDAQMEKARGRQTPETQHDLARLLEQKNALVSQARMSSIELAIQQNPDAMRAAAASSSWSKDALNSALSSAGNVFRLLGAALIWLTAFAPLWGAVLMVIWLARRQHGRKAAQS